MKDGISMGSYIDLIHFFFSRKGNVVLGERGAIYDFENIPKIPLL